MKTVHSITYGVYNKERLITTVEVGAQTLKEAIGEKRDIEMELREIYEGTHVTLEKVTQIMDNGGIYIQNMNFFPLSSCV